MVTRDNKANDFQNKRFQLTERVKAKTVIPENCDKRERLKRSLLWCSNFLHSAKKNEISTCCGLYLPVPNYNHSRVKDLLTYWIF